MRNLLRNIRMRLGLSKRTARIQFVSVYFGDEEKGIAVRVRRRGRWYWLSTYGNFVRHPWRYGIHVSKTIYGANLSLQSAMRRHGGDHKPLFEFAVIADSAIPASENSSDNHKTPTRSE